MEKITVNNEHTKNLEPKYKMANPVLFWCGGIGVIFFAIIGNATMPSPQYIGAFLAGVAMAFIGGRNKNKQKATK